MTAVVLDASAMLALFHREPGAAIVAAHAATASVSSVTLAEVAGKMSDFGLEDDVIESAIKDMSLSVIEFDREAALSSGKLRRATRFLGLSLGDRACLALALSLGAPVLTADRAWARLRLPIEIRLIR